jgi:hypothetical protein
MNTCDACKHWQRIPNRPPEAYGNCTALANDDGCPADMACIPEACDRYGDRLQPELITGPKFGCCHWDATAKSPEEHEEDYRFEDRD